MTIATLNLLEEIQTANVGTVIVTLAASVSTMLGVIAYFFRWMVRRSDLESRALRDSNSALIEANAALRDSVDAMREALRKMEEHTEKLEAILQNTNKLLLKDGSRRER